MDEKRLTDVPLFASLSKKDRRRLAALADEVDISAGRELIHEGRFAYDFFVIEDGRAEVVRGGEHVADLGPGDFFGEMGAVGDATRSATVVARSPMTAIVMSAGHLRQVAREMPAVGEQLQRAIEERTRTLATV